MLWKHPLLALALVAAVGFVPGRALAQNGGSADDKVRDIQKQLMNIDVMLKTAFDNLHADIQTLSKRLEKYQETQKKLDTRVTGAEEEIKQLNGLVTTLQAEVLLLQKKLNGDAGPPPLAGGKPPVPANPVNNGGDGLKQLADRIEKLEKAQGEAGAAGQTVAALQAQFKKLEEAFMLMQKDVAAMQDGMNSTKSLYPPAALGEMSDRLSKLEKMVKDIQTTIPSVSGSSPAGKDTGRIIVLNNTSRVVLFVSRNRTERVQPYERLVLDNQPTGTFSYEIISDPFGTLRRSTPTLNAGETLTIRVE